MAQELTEAELRGSKPTVLDPGYVPAIIRICSATMVGALIGAPLGALAIHEDILQKIAEAAIVTGLGAIAAEIAAPLSELARSPEQPPAEPTEAPHTSVVDELFHPETTPGRLPDLDDDVPSLTPPLTEAPSEPPWPDEP